jgi:hypothetical protein
MTILDEITFLHHPEFDTQARRTGIVARVNPSGTAAWRLHMVEEKRIGW